MLSDTHFKDNTPEDLALAVQLINDCGKTAQSRKTDTVIILGDCFDSKHRYSQELLLAVYKALSYWHSRGINFLLLRGNHDSFGSQPETTILEMFDRVATVINKPTMVEEPDCVLFFLPWYPAEKYRKLVKHYASYAVGYSKPRLLLSHVSVQEGMVGPSNTKITTPIRVTDLLPEVWTGGVYLGDYHIPQRVETRKEYDVRYLGSPRPFTHGDAGNIGLWVIEVSQCSKKLIPCPLPSRYPAYVSYRVDTLKDLPLQNYDLRDKHRIFVRLNLRNHVGNLYPDAKLEEIDALPEMVDGGGGRLSDVEKLNSAQVANKWLKLKGLGPEYKQEVKNYL